MKALILNSGTGSRMGDITNKHPKAMTEIKENETILSRQLKFLANAGIEEVIITTGSFHESLEEYCESLNIPLKYEFVYNPLFDKTNYIYSIYLARESLDSSLVFMHGDLVFDESVLNDVLSFKESCMTVSTTKALPKKDFKAVINEGRISKVGIEFFENALEAQPLYKLNKEDWRLWLDNIIVFCEKGEVRVYAENAFNEISDKCIIYPFDVKDRLCGEIDDPEDLEIIKDALSRARKEGINNG